MEEIVDKKVDVYKKIEETKNVESYKEIAENKNAESQNNIQKSEIFDYTFWRILAYFIIYSICGFIIETIFGFLTKGVLESRKSMLYGPFCCIYGAGAICLICIPKKLKKSNWILFATGIIIGSMLEYVVSWAGECIFHIKWWDYSNLPFNINGRICLLFSVFWGILTVCLNKIINPTVDKWIDKIPEKRGHKIIVALSIIMIIDEAITCFALKMFFTRIIYNNKLDVQGVDTYYQDYLDLYQNHENIKKIVDTVFSDKKMLMTFPNIKLTLKNGDIILVRDVLNTIKPYYIKVFTPKNDNLDLDLNFINYREEN